MRRDPHGPIGHARKASHVMDFQGRLRRGPAAQANTVKRVSRKKKREETTLNGKTEDAGPEIAEPETHSKEDSGPELAESGIHSREDVGPKTEEEEEHNKAKHEDKGVTVSEPG
ncbi:hypothetical protein NDU88_009273 [Pleurodeles waltl]|uniref:Uncharacterized protein n=1 Tax=Pleurodeles waltl TaxID=8319 RepID=A0AAV7P7H3_PLEWA|nr:hypothetical protein NDU88_009273 [Pleurodeles waltl]